MSGSRTPTGWSGHDAPARWGLPSSWEGGLPPTPDAARPPATPSDATDPAARPTIDPGYTPTRPATDPGYPAAGPDFLPASAPGDGPAPFVGATAGWAPDDPPPAPGTPGAWPDAPRPWPPAATGAWPDPAAGTWAPAARGSWPPPGGGYAPPGSPYAQPGFAPQPGYVTQPGFAPPAAPPPSTRAGWGALLVIFLVVGAVLAYSVATPRPSGPLGAGGSTPTAVAPPTAATTPGTPAEQRLMANPLYRQTLSGSCPAQTSPASEAAYHLQVKALIRCLEAAYRGPLEAAGFSVDSVEVVYYGDKVDTPCGREDDAYAFYCEENRTIYFSADVYKASADDRLALADVVIHEYGHHVQGMADILSSSYAWYDANAVTRRTELQTYCWTYYAFANIDGFDLQPDDLAVFENVWAYTDDPEGHGSVAAQQRWGPRGLHGTTLGACNTWNVSYDEVK